MMIHEPAETSSQECHDPCSVVQLAAISEY